jgi:hypothetical protein
MTMTLSKRLSAEALDSLVLLHGNHDSREAGVCVMEAAAWMAGEPHTDHPKCVSRILAAFLRRWNDDLDEAGRQKLKPYIPRVIGTAKDGQDELRGWLIADWVIRVHTPAWLELAGIHESARALRSLPELRDLASLSAAQPSLDKARSEAAAAWAAARAAAGAAAGDAAWDAAGAAAWDAARAAARAAAGAAARDAAWAAAWDAARDAAWAGAAAKQKLAPTVASLQVSAFQLLEKLVDPAGAKAA